MREFGAHHDKSIRCWLTPCASEPLCVVPHLTGDENDQWLASLLNDGLSYRRYQETPHDQNESLVFLVLGQNTTNFSHQERIFEHIMPVLAAREREEVKWRCA
eukprot:CAMPEP_0116836094 /NCGR_PEP_ID=MMETSP0418-20121206/7903_1 /TAXON_ID=1158023 /ORGANISM="Astrosyne radiata, Strain 13vi08-1A" /LENGTH=102 /DNA_ID=CAMNT_0004465821 /DNA_START=2231 /DNA_END=2535 /DNA_ORIENTATION=+